MKTQKIFVNELKREIVFHIGVSAKDNFDVIDVGDSDDLWFHAKDESSCHVVAELPFRELNKKPDIIKNIIEIGANLCKENTHKLANKNRVPIIYTEVKNVKKTKTLGSVNVSSERTILV